MNTVSTKDEAFELQIPPRSYMSWNGSQRWPVGLQRRGGGYKDPWKAVSMESVNNAGLEVADGRRNQV